MSLNLGADAENIMIVRDIVDFNYEKAKDSLLVKSISFYVFILFPIIVQFFIPTEYPTATRVLCISVILGELNEAYSEYQNWKSRYDKWSYFDLQNLIDIASITFSMVFCALRIINPIEFSYSDDDAVFDVILQMQGDDRDRISQSKPLFGYIVFTLIFGQWLEYLKTTDVLNMYLSLL